MTRQQRQRLLAVAIAPFLLTTFHLAAQRGADPETRFRDALQKQQVQGDLTGAMQIYQEIAASGTASKALKARALLQLAASLETLGQQAETVYQRILKEFDDQPAASQARTKLAALKPTAVTLTQIRFGAGVQHVVATDGQRAVYWDSERTTLFIGDIAGKSRTRIFGTTSERRPRAEVSRDLSRVFLYFVPTEGNPGESYAVIRTDGSGIYREVNLTAKGFNELLPLFDVTWSFDNRYVVICKMGEGRVVRPLKLWVDDGRIEELLPGSSTSIQRAVLSPDGRSMALQEGRNFLQKIYIKPVQGGEMEMIAEHGAVADWTLDGRHLVFAAAEKSAFSLYTMPVLDGRAAGERTFVRGLGALGDISRPMTSGSSLIFEEIIANQNTRRVYHALLTDEGVLSDWTVLRTFRSPGNQPSFPVSSPDGTRIAYRVTGGAGGSRGSAAVRLHTLATGKEDLLYEGEGPIFNCVWASQPPVIYCGKLSQAERRTTILSIDVATRRTESLASFPGVRTINSLSADERTLQMFNLDGPTNWPRWEIGAAQETPGPQEGFYTSRDGRWALRVTASGNRREIQLRPGSAGDEAWEHLVYLRKQAPDTSNIIPLTFTSDGNWLVFHDLDSNGKDALLRVNSSGGEPQRLADYPTSLPNSYLSISPDGRQFFVEALPDNPREGQRTEHSLLQNFLPRTATTTSKP